VHVVRGHEAIREALERDRREEAQRFTILASRVPVGIFETDPAGNVVYVNDRWQEITGMSDRDFIGGGQIVHPEERDGLRAEWAAAAAEGRDFRREFRLLRPDGEVRWVSAHATGLRNEDGELTGFIGSALDITGRRSAEERTEAVVSRIALAVAVIGPDGSILHANDASLKIIETLAYETGPVGEHAWSTVDTDGNPVANEDLPVEITRTTGLEIDDRVLGFPAADGTLLWLRISTRRLSDLGPPYTVVTSYADITGQREDAARLAEAQRRFELAFDHAPIGVTLVSLGGRLRRVNRALCEMFGYVEEELLASTFQGLTEDFDEDLEQFQRMLAGEIGSYEMEKRYTHKDGSLVWALVSVSLVRGDDGEPRYFIAQILDITQRRRLERELRHLAEHDNLTGLFNRRAFGVALQRELTRERRYGDEWALLMIDLDGFKEINDTHGHAAGDLVLRAVAATIGERVRDTDVAARLGGDEFAVMLPATGREGAEVLAIDLVQALRELSVDIGSGEQVSITASVGLACSSELPDDRDEDTVLVAADLAMYEAKRTGRDGYVVHGG
jgi:diguanylate cyclase (GGDEF)-like protein/PAS domain S-box-containing protein